MPKSNIVFRESFEDDESDDEIVIIPYTKPPPVVIDLLESAESDNGSDQRASKKSPKKKSRKKKNKRDKERGQGQGGSIDVASLGDLTLESSVSSLNVSACVPDDNIIECVEEITSGQAVEPTTSVEVVACGSENVAAVSNVSSTGFSSDTQLPSNSRVVVEGSGSHFENCIDAQSSEVGNVERTETGMLMVGTPSAQNNEKTNKRVRSERKSKGEGKSRTRTTSSSATQRTNEEIVNFLTTLGIQMEPNAFETPVTRKKQSRRRPCQAPTAVEGEANSLDSSATNSNDGQNFPVPIKDTTTTSAAAAFVSITQDISSASKRNLGTSKGRRQRQAISGDLSDYTVSFTSKELNAINTSFQSNILLAETGGIPENARDSFVSVSSSVNNNQKSQSPLQKTKPNYYSEVIDAVARGLESSSLPSSSLESENAQQAINYDKNSEKDTESLNNKNRNGSQDSVHNQKHIEETRPTAVASNSSDIGNGNNSISSNISPKPTSTLTVAKEIASAVVGSPNLSVGLEKVSKSSVASADTSTLIETEKQVQTPEDVGNRNKLNVEIITTRDIEGKRKLSDDEPSKTASLANKNTVEEGARAKGNKENSSFKGQSPERKRRRVGNNDIILVSPKTHGINREKTLEKDAPKNVQEGSCVSVLTTVAPERQMSANNNSKGHVPQESYYPSTWSDHMRDFYGSIRNEDFEMDEIWPSLSDSRHLWRAYKDSMPPPRKHQRHVRCNRCKQFGHLVKDCSEKWKEPTCHYCGKVGHTSDNQSRHSRTCPSAVCLNCGRQLARYAQKCHRCLLQSRPRRCGICNVSGHDDSICPDNWRRFHSIISPDEYEKTKEILKPNSSNENDRENLLKSPKLYKRPSTMYCANCGRRGHCYYDCNGSKFNPYPRHKPFVVCEAQANEVQSKIVQRPHSSASSTASAPIPISYDSRTGRTVVMNAETTDQPELEVEIIQVQITNELALHNDESQQTLVTDSNKQSTLLEKEHLKATEKDPYKCTCENKKCANKLRQDEKCYQTLMGGQAHLKLLRAQQKGILQPIEERNQVQISVINDGCRVHITGSGVFEADKDLHKLLWSQNTRKQIPVGTYGEPIVRVEENLNQKISNDENTRETSAVVNTSQLITVDDEDECVILVETTNSESCAGSTNEREKVVCPQNSTQNNNYTHGKEFFFMDLSASGNTEEIGIDNESSESTRESAAEGENATGKASWSEYVSPLTGMSLSLNSEHSHSSNTNTEEDKNRNTSALGLSSSKSQLVVESNNTNIDENMGMIVDDCPSSPDMFEDVEEMDYSTMQIQDTTGDTQLSATLTENKNSSDSDVEIITIDDDEEELTPEPPKQTCWRREESVTLLQSEWDLAMTELAKTNNIINQIAKEFSVDIEVSKEISSVLVRSGTDHARKRAKDEIVSWLESKCLNTEYHLVRYADKQTFTPSKPKKKSKSKQMALRLRDVQKNNFPGQQKFNKKGKTKSRRNKMFNNSNSSGNSSGSSNSHSFLNVTTSPINHVPNFNKRNFKKSSPSSPFNHRGLIHSPTPKKMQHNSPSNNNNSASFSIGRGRGGSSTVSNRRKVRYFDVKS